MSLTSFSRFGNEIVEIYFHSCFSFPKSARIYYAYWLFFFFITFDFPQKRSRIPATGLSSVRFEFAIRVFFSPAIEKNILLNSSAYVINITMWMLFFFRLQSTDYPFSGSNPNIWITSDAWNVPFSLVNKKKLVTPYSVNSFHTKLEVALGWSYANNWSRDRLP